MLSIIIENVVNSSMTHVEVAEWLSSKCIPYEFCQIFEANYIDGEEFLNLTIDELKDMCPLGIAKKIFRLIPSHNQLVQQFVTSTNSTSQAVVSLDTASNISEQLSDSALSLGASASVVNDEGGSPYSSVTSISMASAEIPKLWNPLVNACIKNKQLTDGARDEIVRRLVDILFAKSSKPTRSDCVEMGRKLILKHPWMKDNTGMGPCYVSKFGNLRLCYDFKIYTDQLG
jgi:hypothetical protein